jgi:hypothetical protein
MKIICSPYKFSYDVDFSGIKKSKNKISKDYQVLYDNILKLLNVDFVNAPVSVLDGNPLNQKIQYVINNNKALKITTDKPIKIPKNTEKLQSNNWENFQLF